MREVNSGNLRSFCDRLTSFCINMKVHMTKTLVAYIIKGDSCLQAFPYLFSHNNFWTSPKKQPCQLVIGLYWIHNSILISVLCSLGSYDFTVAVPDLWLRFLLFDTRVSGQGFSDWFVFYSFFILRNTCTFAVPFYFYWLIDWLIDDYFNADINTLENVYTELVT